MEPKYYKNKTKNNIYKAEIYKAEVIKKNNKLFYTFNINIPEDSTFFELYEKNKKNIADLLQYYTEINRPPTAAAAAAGGKRRKSRKVRKSRSRKVRKTRTRK